MRGIVFPIASSLLPIALVSIALVSIALVSIAPVSVARADEEPTEGSSEPEDDLPPVSRRPTSGEASLFSGRTLGVGETMIGGAAGWPGIFAIVEHALTSSFNLGIRAGLNYGSPMMGLEPAVGGELAIPMRVHLLGEGDFDMAAYLEPAFSAGEGASVGESGSFRGDFGWSSRLELGGLLGFHVADGLTIMAGFGGYAGFVHIPASANISVVGAALAQLGIEGLISRDTMLFAIAGGGVGFADDPGGGSALFDAGLTSVILRLALGIAYLL